MNAPVNAPVNAYSSSSSANAPVNNALGDEKEKSYSMFSFLSQASNKDVVPVDPLAQVAPVAQAMPAAAAAPQAKPVDAAAQAAPYTSTIINVAKSISSIPSSNAKEVVK